MANQQALLDGGLRLDFRLSFEVQFYEYTKIDKLGKMLQLILYC